MNVYTCFLISGLFLFIIAFMKMKYKLLIDEKKT